MQNQNAATELANKKSIFDTIRGWFFDEEGEFRLVKIWQDKKKRKKVIKFTYTLTA